MKATMFRKLTFQTNHKILKIQRYLAEFKNKHFKIIRLSKLFLLLFVVSLIVSCVQSKKHMEYEVPIRKTTSLKYAYISADKIYIKQVNEQKPLLFEVNTQEIIQNNRDSRIAAENIIKIEQVDNQQEEELKQNPDYTKVASLSRFQWEMFIEPVATDIIVRLIPKTPYQGVMFTINHQELLVYYNAKQELEYCMLYDKPHEVTVVQSYSNEEYNQMIFYAIKHNPKIMRYAYNDIVVFESSVDALNYPFGIIDLKNERILYFDYSATYDFNRKVKSIAATISLASSIVIKSHIFALVKNPVSSLHNGAFIIKNKLVKILKDGSLKTFQDMPPLNTSGEMMDLTAFNQLLNRKVNNDIFKGKIDFLIGGEAYYPELIKEIQKAQQDIKIRLYIFDNDDYGSMIADLLKEASKYHDVDVKVLMDSFANITKSVELPELPFRKNFKTPNSIKLYLKQGNSGVRVRTSANTWLTFDHVKTLIFDENIVFTGGMNIGQEYRYSWHDLMARIEGPVVGAISREFDNAWARNSTLGDLNLLYHKSNAKTNQQIRDNQDFIDYDQMYDLRLLFTKPGRRDIFTAQILAIQNAKKEIFIENPYLADKRIVEALIHARRRGVDVRIILPANNNVYMMAKNNKYLTNIFLANKIRVFWYPGMTHVKASLYDGWANIGSANFDSLSFDTNRELNIAFDHPEAIAKLKAELFDKDFALSTEITEPIEIHWTDRTFAHFANQF